ncbi:bifunctional folylpolyglutamate synthase/dihydrofolate synthase, partial [Arcobacter sp. 31_11_sub10_T18]
FGRCQKIRENITIDVGHNPLAASVIKDFFEKKEKKVSLVYNCFSDKDYKKVLTILYPIINEISIINVSDNRIVDKKNLLEVCADLNIKVDDFKSLEQNKEYLVFGSFSVVEEFLKVYVEK